MWICVKCGARNELVDSSCLRCRQARAKPRKIANREVEEVAEPVSSEEQAANARRRRRFLWASVMLVTLVLIGVYLLVAAPLLNWPRPFDWGPFAPKSARTLSKSLTVL